MKKIILGIFLVVMLFNVSLCFKSFPYDISLGSLYNMATAQESESDDSHYTNVLEEEDGLCDECYLGYQSTCSCTNYSIYCRSNGSEDCEYSSYTVVDDFTCTIDGSSC